MGKLVAGGLLGSLAVAALTTLFVGSCGGQALGGRGGSGGSAGTFAGSGGGAGAIAGSGGVAGAAGQSSGLGGGGPIDCGAILDLPPILTIVDGSTGAPVCDPTFVVELDASTAVQATSYRCLAADRIGCPVISTTDGQPPPCVFLLYGLFETGQSYTVAVSAPGYLTSQVAGVAGGQAATCGFPFVAPSQLTVSLFHEN
jgi:hypothetical protein